jgi:hypothetical protein
MIFGTGSFLRSILNKKNSLCRALHSDWPSVEISATLLECQGPMPPTSSWRSLGNQKMNPNYHFPPTRINHHWILTNHPNISIRHPTHLQQKEILLICADQSSLKLLEGNSISFFPSTFHTFPIHQLLFFVRISSNYF